MNRGPVGAIRWDAWVGDLASPGLQVERNLSPSYYQHRVAFYGEILSSTQILARATTQAVIDKEIAFAHAAGLDFWAYVLYDDALATARHLHQSSLHKIDMNFCILHEGGRVGSGGMAAWPAKIQWYIDFFKEPNYQTVLNGRPLLFVLSPENMVGANLFSSDAEAAAAFVQLRDAVVSAGMPSPYLVGMNFNVSTAANNRAKYGFDAISSYAIGGNATGAEPYSTLRSIAESWWDDAKASGAKIIPPVTAGWDRRPRIENPVSWEPWQTPGDGINDYYERPTPQELGAHVQAARDWCSANAAVAEADALLIYAWNENDEGGWIVPTLSERAAHLEAIRGALNALPDLDGDRMPDVWETWYFDSPRKASSTTDYDLDGVLDSDEYVGGTAPDDTYSLFALIPSALNHFKWDGKAGRSYLAWNSLQLVPSDWSVYTNIGPLSADQRIELSMPSSPTASFCRIEVSLDGEPGATSLIPVVDGSFENPDSTNGSWTTINALWNPTVSDPYQLTTGYHLPAAAEGTWFGLMLNVGTIHQDLATTVQSGDTLSVTFFGGRSVEGVNTSGGGIFEVKFIVGTTPYRACVDTTVLAPGNWKTYTYTVTVANTGNLRLEFSHVSGNAWLDHISPVTRTEP